MKNKYEIRGDITAIFILSPKYGEIETLISTTKLQKVLEYSGSWCAGWSPNTRSFYIVGHERVNGKRIRLYLHRWIIDAPNNKHVDHQDCNTLNNLDSNLRIVTHRENCQNKKGACKNNKSGVRGVSWHKSSNRWQAQFYLNKKYHYVGNFKTLKEAERAVMKARSVYMTHSKECSYGS